MRAVKKLSLVGLALGLGLAPALVGAVTPAGAQTGSKVALKRSCPSELRGGVVPP